MYGYRAVGNRRIPYHRLLGPRVAKTTVVNYQRSLPAVGEIPGRPLTLGETLLEYN